MIPYRNSHHGRGKAPAAVMRSAVVAGGQTPASQGAQSGDILVCWKGVVQDAEPRLTGSSPVWTLIQDRAGNDGRALYYTVLNASTRMGILQNTDSNGNPISTEIQGVCYTGAVAAILQTNQFLSLPASLTGFVRDAKHVGILQYDGGSAARNVTGVNPTLTDVSIGGSNLGSFRDRIPPLGPYTSNTAFAFSGSGGGRFLLIELRGT